MTRREERPTDHRGRYLPDGGWPPGRSAPEPLERVRRFMNSSNIESGADHFETTDALRAWLGREGYDAAACVTESERRRAVVVREALRDLARANHDGGVAEAATGALDLVAARVPMTASFVSGPRLITRATGVDAALAAILAAVYDAMVGGTWFRLKSCRNAHCRWAFYDRSRNGSSAWCSALACGSRMKVRAYRARRRVEHASAGTDEEGAP